MHWAGGPCFRSEFIERLGTDGVYHCGRFPWSRERERVPHPLWCSKGARGSLDEEQTETVQRAKGSALHHIQLLRKEAAAGARPRQKSFCEDSWGSARAARVQACRICADAGARASLAERTGQGYAVEGDPGIEAKSV